MYEICFKMMFVVSLRKEVDVCCVGVAWTGLATETCYFSDSFSLLMASLLVVDKQVNALWLIALTVEMCMVYTGTRDTRNILLRLASHFTECGGLV